MVTSAHCMHHCSDGGISDMFFCLGYKLKLKKNCLLWQSTKRWQSVKRCDQNRDKSVRISTWGTLWRTRRWVRCCECCTDGEKIPWIWKTEEDAKSVVGPKTKKVAKDANSVIGPCQPGQRRLPEHLQEPLRRQQQSPEWS